MTVITRGWDRLTLPGKFLFILVPLLIVASLWYLIMTLTLSVPQSMIERRFSRSSRPVVKVKESLL